MIFLQKDGQANRRFNMPRLDCITKIPCRKEVRHSKAMKKILFYYNIVFQIMQYIGKLK